MFESDGSQFLLAGESSSVLGAWSSVRLYQAVDDSIRGNYIDFQPPTWQAARPVFQPRKLSNPTSFVLSQSLPSWDTHDCQDHDFPLASAFSWSPDNDSNSVEVCFQQQFSSWKHSIPGLRKYRSRNLLETLTSSKVSVCKQE